MPPRRWAVVVSDDEENVGLKDANIPAGDEEDEDEEEEDDDDDDDDEDEDETDGIMPRLVNRFECRTCPYMYIIRCALTQVTHFSPARSVANTSSSYVIDTALTSVTHFSPNRTVPEIRDDDAAYRTSERMPADCPNKDCTSREAYFQQMQTRSADEAMTVFCRCVKCGRMWRIDP